MLSTKKIIIITNNNFKFCNGIWIIEIYEIK